MTESTPTDGSGTRQWRTFERRVGKRRQVKIAARVTGLERSRAGVVREISVSGALLCLPSPLRTGRRVVLELIISRNLRMQVAATVVRSEPAGSRSSGPWRSRVAVAFEESLGSLERIVSGAPEPADAPPLWTPT